MREHGVIFSCSEADELRMLDQRRTIWDNDTVEKKRSGRESSVLLAGNSYIKLILGGLLNNNQAINKKGILEMTRFRVEPDVHHQYNRRIFYGPVLAGEDGGDTGKPLDSKAFSH